MLERFLQVIFASLRRDFFTINFNDFIKQLESIIFADRSFFMDYNDRSSNLK